MSAARTSGGVICAGRLYCDLIFTGLPRAPSPGTEIFAEGLSFHPGGGAMITAAHLAALGRAAHLAAVLPVAELSAAILPRIEETGVSLELCVRPAPGADPQVTVALTDADDRAFVTRRSGAAIPPIAATTLARLAKSGVVHLHIGEIASAIDAPALIGAAQDAGMTVSADCAWDENMSPDAIAPLLAELDVFLPNAEEDSWLAERGVQAPDSVLTVVKCGACGARARGQGADLHVPTRPVEAVDPTGAGDAFNAGFLDAWLKGLPLEEALAAGNACGGRAVCQPGGLPPARSEAANNVAFVK